MLPVTVIVVLLSLVSCKGEATKGTNLNGRERCDERDVTFYIEIDEHSVQQRKTRYKTDFRYQILNDNAIDITCSMKKKGKSLTLQWKDNYGFETAYHEDYQSVDLQLKIKPDKDDNGVILTCRAFETCGERNVSITLVASPTDTKFKPDHQFYIKKDEILQNKANCNRTVKFASALTDHSVYTYSANKSIAFKFEESANGTIVSCIRYLDLAETGARGTAIQTYERQKSTAVYYIKPDQVFSTQNEDTNIGQEISTHSIADTAIGRVTENRSGVNINNEKGSESAVAIVGGTLGSLILILVSVILYMWYRKKQRGSSDDAAAQVVYAEIEERPPQLPPPRQNEQPYSKILGTLVPKQQPPTRVDEPLYCQIST